MLPINRIQAPFPVFYIPKYFIIEELVSRKVYERLKKEGRLDQAWALFDVRELMTIDALHEEYNQKIFINDWHKGGNRQHCGLRMDDSANVGSFFSQHKFARGMDKHFEKTSSDQARKDCLENPWRSCFKFITCIEMNVSWFHSDCRNWDKEKLGILKVYP